MSHVNHDDVSSVTSAKAYIQEVKLCRSEPQNGKKAREFLIVKLKQHNGFRRDGSFAFKYPECGFTEDLKELVAELKDRLEKEPGCRIVARVEILNASAKPWFQGDKAGVNDRGTLRAIHLIEQEDAQ
ncbi:hypothetical protein [Eleftheria terrae]|uniref:hypothetical protein n=1 Tax=Eleftheria terrae TaxID=1597781 RepID=UPI00263BAB69|nr:hypothetical protein [Eleftheria terrae]WKB50540.1 hypothetical protein N7L95_00030 [Eleftheria terrae]